MIQELLGGAGIIEEDRKFSISTLESSPSLSPSSSTITATTAAAAPASSSASAENQTLRCPRCNSSNTKFCYYNNYNLTQPRHFCKTCRRYWTKGGALRNVPIGGGCRKNKNVSVTSVAKSSPGRLKNVSAEIGKAGGLVGGFDQELPSNSALWASPPQNSQFLALLRATQNPSPNPNPNPNPIPVKKETVMIGSHLASNSMGQTLGLDLFNQDPGSFFWRNNQHQAQQQQQQQNHHHHHHHHHHQHHQQQTGFILGEVQNSQEIYQRLRSIPNYYNPDHHSALLLSNAASSSSSTILESAPASATELGYWNPALPWSDLPTSNGAYP